MEGLGQLELAILKSLSERRTLEEVARITKVEPNLLGEKIAEMQIRGYISPEGFLTKKGLQAVNG
jgi:hypothetical protein